MHVQQTISKVWNTLPPVFQGLVILVAISLAIYIIDNKGVIDNITHLLQAFPPIVYFPIAFHPTSKMQEKDEPSHDTSPPAPTA